MDRGIQENIQTRSQKRRHSCQMALDFSSDKMRLLRVGMERGEEAEEQPRTHIVSSVLLFLSHAQHRANNFNQEKD
jgi:hypothetical protein